MPNTYKYLAYALVGVYMIGMLMQQALARKFLQEGVRWSSKTVQGKFFGTLEPYYWVWFLISLQWRNTSLAKKTKAQCLIWALFDIVMLTVIFALFGYFTWR